MVVGKPHPCAAQQAEAGLVAGTVGDELGGLLQRPLDLLSRGLPHGADLLEGDEIGTDRGRDGRVRHQMAGRRSRIGPMNRPRPGPAHPALYLRLQRRGLRVILEIALAESSCLIDTGGPSEQAYGRGHQARPT